MTTTDLKPFAEECVTDHLENGEAYGCVGEPESYSAAEFAQFWLDGVAGDECRKDGIDFEIMRAALIEAWNAR